VPIHIDAMAPSRKALVPVTGSELDTNAAVAGVELAAVGLVAPAGATVVAPGSEVEIDEAEVGVLTPSYQAISAAATGSPIGSG
jgi:hypothetical protein